jgi:hypothetical protein
MEGITNLLILNKMAEVPFFKRKLIIIFTSAIIVYSSLVFEPHNQEIIFSDTTYDMEFQTYYGKAIGANLIWTTKDRFMSMFTNFRRVIVLLIFLILV